MSQTLHIVGAGLAGLSCAVHAQKAGYQVKLYEAAPQAGGRIRSVHDKINKTSYDNGTHLIVEGYRFSFEYLNLIGSLDQLVPLETASYSFVEPASQLSWQLPARHLLWHLLKGRVPGIGLSEIWPILKILSAKNSDSLDHLLKDDSVSRERFWNPLILSVFNCAIHEVSLKVLKETLFEIFKAGPNAFRPFFAKNTLYDCFIEPALKSLDITYAMRLTGIETEGKKLKTLKFKGQDISIHSDDLVVFALPAQAYHQIETGLIRTEFKFNPITNIHFFLDNDLAETFIGFVGTNSQWVYAKNKHACVTISDYDLGKESESILFAEKIWQEVSQSLNLKDTPTPQNRVIVEKYATTVQNSAFANSRAKTKTRFSNVFLCGDWIETKLPATIESAIKSGKMAAQAILSANF